MASLPDGVVRHGSPRVIFDGYLTSHHTSNGRSDVGYAMRGGLRNNYLP